MVISFAQMVTILYIVYCNVNSCYHLGYCGGGMRYLRLDLVIWGFTVLYILGEAMQWAAFPAPFVRGHLSNFGAAGAFTYLTMLVRRPEEEERVDVVYNWFSFFTLGFIAWEVVQGYGRHGSLLGVDITDVASYLVAWHLMELSYKVETIQQPAWINDNKE